MNARNTEITTPSKIFRAPVVAPSLESASIAADEFALKTTNAMELTREIWRARCAYDKVLQRRHKSWRTVMDLSSATN